MGRLIEKMYGSYSDADLNDWERLPMNASVLTSSAFGAWLLRRDERRDKAIPKDHVYKAIQEMMKYEHEGFINISLARLDEILKKCGVSEDAKNT